MISPCVCKSWPFAIFNHVCTQNLVLGGAKQFESYFKIFDTKMLKTDP